MVYKRVKMNKPKVVCGTFHGMYASANERKCSNGNKARVLGRIGTPRKQDQFVHVHRTKD